MWFIGYHSWCFWRIDMFSNSSCRFFSDLNHNCSNFLDLRNHQEQDKKAFCYQKLLWPFTVWINWSSDLKNFVNSRAPTWNFKSFSQSLEQFFLTLGQNNFGNKIPLFWYQTSLWEVLEVESYLICSWFCNTNIEHPF